LIEQPEFRDIDALVRCSKQGVIRADYTRTARLSEEDVSPERALELYRAGCTLYMNALSTPALRQWTQALDTILGLLPGTAQINAFASLPGRGLSWHWDPQEIFVVQIQGRKLWHVAPNEDLEWPTASGQAGAERRREIRLQLKDPNKVVAKPTRWQSIELQPGSVMFMPRGYWHTTENIDASLHLVLQVKMPSWRDVFTFLLQNAPELYSLEWRQPSAALRPERLLDAGVQEFKDRCASLAAFASPQGVMALTKLFGNSKSEPVAATSRAVTEVAQS
jgi:ribosomal protein L16 Arg81 hydroxylase